LPTNSLIIIPPKVLNNIFAKKIVDSIPRKNQPPLVISAATETSHWRRIDSSATSAGNAVKDAIMKSPEIVPEGPVEVCVR
jgi:hypothetical protein